MKNQKVILGTLGIAAALGLGFLVIKPQSKTTEEGNLVQPEKLSGQLCFYREIPAARGFKDISAVSMNIAGVSATGEVRNLPAEKDSKVGTFEGVVSPINPATGEYTADVFWNSLAEGMQVKEQVLIVFNSNHAKIGFGEMIPRDDGAYVYKDRNNLTYIDVPKTDCATFVPPQKPLPPVVNPAPTASQFNQVATLHLNTKTTFSDGLNVILKKINDSTCPKDVQCFWAGELSVDLLLSSGQFGTAGAEISVGTNKSVVLKGYTFSLRDATANSATIIVQHNKP